MNQRKKGDWMLDLVIGIIGFTLTVIIFSYIIKDNFFFKLAVYLLVGVSAGYTLVILVTRVLIPYLVTPLLEGTWLQRVLALIPLVLSGLIVLMIFTRFSKAGRLPAAILIGIISAVTIVGVTVGTILPQMEGAINLFSPSNLSANQALPWIQWVDAIIMLLGTITTLLFFYTGAARRGNGSEPSRRSFTKISKIGQVFVGISLGALFAGIYSAALLALISRISVIRDFINHLFSL